MFAVLIGANFPKSDPDLITKRVEETRLLVLHPLKHKHRSESQRAVWTSLTTSKVNH